MTIRASLAETSPLLRSAQELLQHVSRGHERSVLNPSLKPEVADKIVEALVELRERVSLLASRGALRWHPQLGWIPTDSACFASDDKNFLVARIKRRPVLGSTGRRGKESD